jgi:glycolate oxidase
VRAALSATFAGVREAVGAVTGIIERRVVPAAIELIDGESLRALEAYVGRPLVPARSGAMVIVECDGMPAAVGEELDRIVEACAAAGATAIRRAASDTEREDLWRVWRQLSLALRATGLLKINHDVVVPRGRVPQLLDAVGELASRHRLRVASFGHAGDGNIHVNLLVNREDAAEVQRAREAARELFERVVALEGSISGEHGIGFAKAPYLAIELSADEIALMKRVKHAFDPQGILNPGKIFP